MSTQIARTPEKTMLDFVNMGTDALDDSIETVSGYTGQYHQQMKGHLEYVIDLLESTKMKKAEVRNSLNDRLEKMNKNEVFDQALARFENFS